MSERVSSINADGSPTIDPQTIEQFRDWVWEKIVSDTPDALSQAIPVLNKFPNDSIIMAMTIIATLRDKKPQQELRYLDRFTKELQMLQREDVLLRVVALAQQDLWSLAWQQLHKYDVWEVKDSINSLPVSWDYRQWFLNWVDKIERHESERIRLEKLKESLAKRKVQKEAAKKPEPKSKSKKAEVEAGPDAAPTDQAYQVFEDLNGRTNAQLEKLKQVMATDVPAFNKLVRDQNVPAVFVKPAK